MDLPDLLLIDKPAGITSFDVIRRLRNQLNIKKMGHAGTLDPAATGLLIIGVGPGTKQLDDFLKLDKEYLAEVLLGVHTDSGDLDGRVLEETSVPEFSDTKLEEAVSNIVGKNVLPVSAYSAIKKGGVPMYKLAREAARQGREVTTTPKREMVVHSAELLGVGSEDDHYVLTIRFFVESGTYIRSLAEEIGRQLDVPATLKSLRRTKIGIFDVAHAKQIEEVTSVEMS